jgi:hypothetical protein
MEMKQVGSVDQSMDLPPPPPPPPSPPEVTVNPSRCSNGDSDPFEMLHDSIILHILNLVSEIKVLGRCTVVSKRFHALVPMVESVTVKVDCVISAEDNSLNVRGRGLFGHLVQFVVGSLAKPLQALQQMIGPRKAMLAAVSHHSPGEVLKNFKAIQRLRIELPGGELGVEDGVLLKWKAEFGSTLESCVILGATSVVKPETYSEKKAGKFEFGRPWFLQGRYEDRISQEANDSLMLSSEGSNNGGNLNEEDSDSLPESFYTNGGLKLRVVWTISSLIAASARHYLLQQIISEHPTLNSLTLTDTDGQGMLCMNKEQLEEFKRKPLAASASANRTQVPALNMKLWYAPYMELPGGNGLKGATLVSIKPNEQHAIRKDGDGFMAGAFEEPYRTAAQALSMRRTYLLEMNSF